MKLALAIAASLLAAYFGLYALRRYQDSRPVQYADPDEFESGEGQL
jgi:hypothetical protein